MAQKSNNFESFWKELKRRKVVHVITVYAAVAFVILQLVDIVERPLRLPDWTTALVIVLICIGFVIAVFLSWIYDITPTGVKKTKPVSTVKRVDQTITPTSSGWKIATYVSGAIIIALVAFNFISRRHLNADISKLEKSIAVLPFINDSPDTTNLYFCNGMMDEILTQLQKIGDLKVKSRTSGERYRNPDKDIKDIGKELGVSLIVEGSVRKVNDDLRITAQLINAKTGNHLWAEIYDGKYTDKIFEFQSNVAKRVVKSLDAVITPKEKQLIGKVPTTNMTAHNLYLKANDYKMEYERTRNLNSYQKAVSLYMASIEIDSTFAKAYTGWADIYMDRYYWESYFKGNHIDSCLALLNIALSFDDQLEEAYYMKGNCYYTDGHIEEAIDNYDKALKINPNYYLAYSQKGYILTWVINDFVKGIDNYNKASYLISRDERPSLLRELGLSYMYVGFIDKARNYFQEALTLNGDSIGYLSYMAWLESSTGNFENAILLGEKASKINSRFIPEIVYYSIAGQNQKAYLVSKRRVERFKSRGSLPLQESHRIGYAFWKVGKHKEAEYYFSEQIKYGTESIKLKRDIASGKAAQYDLAATYAFLGDTTKAFQYLDDFNTMNFYPLWWISYAKHDPLFASIRNEERFQKIIQNMESKYQAEYERVRKWLEEQGML